MMDSIKKRPIDKDEYYDTTITKMKRLLKKHGFEIEERQWKNPVKGVYSVHIREKSCPFIYTNGKGSTKEAALTSGLGEFFERISCNYLFSDYHLKSDRDFIFYPNEIWTDQHNFKERCLNTGLWDLYGENLTFSDLLDFNSGSDNICAIPFESVNGDGTVFFPVNILDNLYVSNGMAAGNSIYEARVQAISEIIERRVKFRIISEGISLPPVPNDILEKFPRITESIMELKSHGFEILVNDASLGGEFPVININLINRGGVFAAFGAHPFLETAIERTLTELMQGRELDKFNDLKKPSFDMEIVKDPSNLEEHFIDSTGYISISSLSDNTDFVYGFSGFKGDTKEQYKYLIEILKRESGDIYIADYDHLGIYCCRVLVPGFSEIYPMDDLIYENKNKRALLRNLLFETDFSSIDDCNKLYQFIQDQEFDYGSNLYELIGILPDQKNTFTVCELLILLSMEISEHDDAMMWLEMVNMEDINKESYLMYSSIETVLNINKEGLTLKNFTNYLTRIYGEEALENAISVIEGKLSIFSLTGFEINPIGSDHGTFLNLYQKSLIG
jgi:ribosomal protein S12 methylthiotransferase accessory factor